MKAARPQLCSTFVAIVACLGTACPAQQAADTWWQEYTDSDASGTHVLGFWKFDNDGDAMLADASSHSHQATLRGAMHNAAGRFGGCLESGVGYPIVDESHSIHVTKSPVLSPTGAFALEMWLKPKGEKEFPASTRPVLADMKYVPYNHTGFMFSLPPAGDGKRRLAVEIGLGTNSENWYSRAFALPPGKWRHVAFTYDARGTVRFFVDGADMGQLSKPHAGPMAAAVRPLAIGDRIGSLYQGFPGFIDEVRLTEGHRDFRPVRLESTSDRHVVVRMTKDAKFTGRLVNATRSPLPVGKITARLPGGDLQELPLAGLAANESHKVEFAFDTSLRPGEYEVEVVVEIPEWSGNEAGYRAATRVPLAIRPRPLPARMPVVMWGVGGTDNVIKEIPRLKEMGFTHCLGLGIDYQQVWQSGAGAQPAAPAQIRDGRRMLDTALAHDIRIVAALSPASWLRRAAAGKPFIRVDRNGKHYGRPDVSGNFKQVQDFCFHVGAAMGRAYGDHPAFASALLHTEVRGESQVSFHPVEVESYRQATGAKIPKEVTIKNGVDYRKLADFPKNRVIADDHPILRYLQWFWKQGDGWNHLNTRLHQGLKQHVSRDDFWTFHDPAVRVPSRSGSGGGVDVLSHWTYSYPDPVRIALCTDELFEMARANGGGQDVMKMTQLIWYRSQTAPQNTAPTGTTSPWVDQDPDAAYITIAPMHLREAFWWKMARPIKGIMYHGWQSLVETQPPGAYRYTNPNTRHELKRLVNEVVVPLGPTLLQVPDAAADVVFLESFTSQMFARRGTYGWNHTWAGDMYHVLMYAQLHPRVLYEESLLAGGLQGAKVLVMADCDVLTQSVVKAIEQFQEQGGLVIGDAEVCPAIKPDFVVPRFARSKQADQDRDRLQAAAKQLRGWLDDKYHRVLDSSNADVMTRRRRFGTTDYVFAVNDNRAFGGYVGGYGLVMEDGLPSKTEIRLAQGRHVYDLTRNRELSATVGADGLHFPIELGPCEGRILMITPQPIRQVQVTAPQEATCGQRIAIEVAVTDGKTPLDAVVPVKLQIFDPEGTPAEFSGHYGAVGGRLAIRFDFAPNDRLGVWQVRAKELASGISSAGYVRLTPRR